MGFNPAWKCTDPDVRSDLKRLRMELERLERLIGAPAGAPTDAPFLTYAASSDLSNERVLTAGANITLTPGPGTLTVASSVAGGENVYRSSSLIVTSAGATAIPGFGAVPLDAGWHRIEMFGAMQITGALGTQNVAFYFTPSGGSLNMSIYRPFYVSCTDGGGDPLSSPTAAFELTKGNESVTTSAGEASYCLAGMSSTNVHAVRIHANIFMNVADTMNFAVQGQGGTVATILQDFLLVDRPG